MPAAARAASDVRITFEGSKAGSPITEVVNAGSGGRGGPHRAGGRSSHAIGATGSIAADFRRTTGRRAAPGPCSRSPTRDADRLEPGTARFTFGADVKLDAVNDGGDYDNGNNVVQRGRFNDTTQFKLQIDAGKASCRVAGAKGAVRTISSLPSPPARGTASAAPGRCWTPVTDWSSGDAHRPGRDARCHGDDDLLGRSHREAKFADQTPLSVGGNSHGDHRVGRPAQRRGDNGGLGHAPMSLADLLVAGSG